MWKQRLYSTKSEMTGSTWEPEPGSNYMEHCNERGSENPLEENYYGLVAVSSVTHMSAPDWVLGNDTGTYTNKQQRRPRRVKKKLHEGQHSITSRLSIFSETLSQPPTHTQKAIKNANQS